MTEEINDTSSLDTRIGTVLMKMKDRKIKRRKRTGNKKKLYRPHRHDFKTH